MMSLFELLSVGFEPTGPYATITVSQAFSGTVQWNVMVVPDMVPVIVVLPLCELLMTTSAWVAPWRSGSVAPTIFAVIESPSWALQCVRLNTSPVCGRLPVGWSRLPGPCAFAAGIAAGAKRRAESTIPAATSHEICLGPAFRARASLLFH